MASAKDYVVIAKERTKKYHELYLKSGSGLSFEEFVCNIAGNLEKQKCRKEERELLDEILKKGWWVDEEEGSGIELPQESFLSQDDFDCDLKKIMNKGE